jgi:DNA-binding transcriptional LysR family regulator
MHAAVASLQQEAPVEWSDLQLFVAVVRSGTVRGAARAVRLDPSTVSRRVAALEQALGSRLFERTAHGLVLTVTGKLMLQSGERVESELAELGRRIVGHDGRLRGVVRVTFPGSFSALIHQVAAAFVERCQGIELELLGLDVPLDVDGRQADIAIRVADHPPEHLVGRRVAAMGAAIYASRAYIAGHPAPLADPSHAWVDWDRRLSAKPAMAWVEAQYPKRRIVARGLTTADVAFAVRAGTGVGGLPCLVGDDEPSLVRLVDLPRDVWSSVWLLTHGGVRPAARVRAVIAEIVAALRAERARIEGSAGCNLLKSTRPWTRS